jgi:hypothetical protein
MFPEDGCLHVWGVGKGGVTAFTYHGIECLKQIVGQVCHRSDRCGRQSMTRGTIMRGRI